MNINYDEMLKDLERPQDEVQEIHFPEEEFKTIAGLMADLGYIHTKESLDALQAYMSGYGLLITGDVGTGKTFFFETLFEAERINSNEKDDPFLLIQTRMTYTILRMSDTIGQRFNDINDEIKGLGRADVVFDDIGVEVIANDWGRKFELVPWLVDKRVRARGRTHFTTNLSPDQLLERYGVRTVDRMHELATVIEFKGKSHRKTLPNDAAKRYFIEKMKSRKNRKAMDEYNAFMSEIRARDKADAAAHAKERGETPVSENEIPF